MNSVALFGAGKIGIAIIALLTSSGRYRIRVCDRNVGVAKAISETWPNCSYHKLDVDNEEEALNLLKGVDAAISALPFYYNVKVAELCLKAGVSYFDLTEDVSTTQHITSLAKDTTSHYFVPQCGLAPGFISVVASHLIESFNEVDSVKMRVGALPVYPSNALKYNLTWSTDGLINEYLNLCEVIEDGKRSWVLPLEGYERFSVDGVEYEAFNTSGGVGTLCQTYEGRVKSLNYKTIRYPGHRDLVLFLLNDLKFKDDKEGLKVVLERGIPGTTQDKCIIFVEVRGRSEGKLLQRTYVSTIYNTYINGHHFGAIQLATAAGVCAPLDLILSGNLTPKKGGIFKVEEIPLVKFLSNEFGRYYYDEKALKGCNIS